MVALKESGDKSRNRKWIRALKKIRKEIVAVAVDAREQLEALEEPLTKLHEVLESPTLEEMLEDVKETVEGLQAMEDGDADGPVGMIDNLIDEMDGDEDDGEDDD